MGPELSYVEELLWRAEQPEISAAPFVDCPSVSAAYVPLGKDFNREALETSLAALLRRHEVLRSTYVVNHDTSPVHVRSPVRMIATAAADDRWRLGDIDLLANALVEPLDLDRGPLLRVGVGAMPDGEHLACATVHRIVSDQWSKGLIAEELREGYDAHRAGRCHSMQRAPADYGDYVAWQRGMTEGPTGRALIDFWTHRLHGLDPAGLPADDLASGPGQGHAHRHERASKESASCSFAISAADTIRLRALCRMQRVTMATTLLAMVNLFLHQIGGIEDIVVGVPVSHRRRHEFERVIGQFTNLVIVRTTVSGRMDFSEVLQRVRTAATEAYQHQDLAYGYLVRLLGSERPLFRVVFNFIRADPTAPPPPPFIPALALPPMQALADFTIQIHDRSHDLGGDFVYKADLFTPARVSEFARRFQLLIAEHLDRAAVQARQKRA